MDNFTCWQPLVSIIVITYNSEKYVLETLESTKAQSYKNIELIIADDGSADETINICGNWINGNKERFVNTQLITVEKNTGIPANCNRGIRAASGEWIKLIAGDDILLPDCIQDLLNFAKENNFQHVVSDLKCLKDGVISDYHSFQKERKDLFKLNVTEKYKYFLINPFFLNAPSLLFNKSLIKQFQPFNEKYRILEDQPYFFTLFKNGIDLGFLPKSTVIYRVHSDSIVGKKININLSKALYMCFLEYRKPYITNSIKGILLKWLIEKKYNRQIYHNTGNSFIEKGWLFFYNHSVKKLSSVYLKYNRLIFKD